VPEVRLGEPESSDNYDFCEAEGIKVYITKSLKPSGENISVKLNNLFGFKSFGVFGFKAIM